MANIIQINGYAISSSNGGGGGSSTPAFPYTGSAIISGSLVVTGSTISTLGFTGSLFGTSSWATNARTSSYFTNLGHEIYAQNANTLAVDATKGVLFYVNSTLQGQFSGNGVELFGVNPLTSPNQNISSDDLGSSIKAWNSLYVGSSGIQFVSSSTSASIEFKNNRIQITGSIILPIGTSASYALTASYAANAGSTFNSTSSFIGNGLSSSFNINHGFNTRNLHITVYESGSAGETVYPTIRRTNANTASIIFNSPPALAEYIVYISQ
jgi:hypothetical protein